MCEEAGYQQLEDLVMAYKRPDGEFATVTHQHPTPSITLHQRYITFHQPSSPSVNLPSPSIAVLQVTRSVTIEMLRVSPALRLAPNPKSTAKKEARSKGIKGAKGGSKPRR